MTADEQEHRAQLERVAFGRADSPAEQQRAQDALRQLQRTEAADIRDAAPAAGAAADLSTDAAPHGERTDSPVARSEPESPAVVSLLDRPISALPRWLLPAAAAGLIAVGAIVGIVASGAAGASPSSLPSDHPSDLGTNSDGGHSASVDDTGSPPPLNVGDITAAERWFESAQAPEDALPMPLDMIDPTTSRLVYQATGEYPWSAWVGRNSVEEGFCIVLFHPESGMAESTCGTTSSFILSGLSISTSTGANVNWNGSEITATSTR